MTKDIGNWLTLNQDNPYTLLARQSRALGCPDEYVCTQRTAFDGTLKLTGHFFAKR